MGEAYKRIEKGPVAGDSRMLVLVGSVIVVATALSFSRLLFNDGDTGWHLATGRWILEHGAIPASDPFSFTFRGHEWTAHEWLVDVIMAALRAAGGWAAVSLFFALLIASTFVVVGRELLRSLEPRHVLIALGALGVALAPGMLARPHVVAWLLLAVWMLVLLRARERSGVPPLAAILILALWANMHASYLVGLGLTGVFALEALIEDRPRGRTLARWGVFGAAALLACFATPHGLQGFLYPFQVSGMKALPLIGEWRTSRLPDDSLFLLFAGVLVAIGMFRWRAVGPVRLLLLAGLGVMALLHLRHQPLFAIVGLMSVLPRAFGAGRAAASLEPRQLAVVGVMLATVGGFHFLIPYERMDGLNYPRVAMAWLPAEVRARPVLNDYSFGGPLADAGIAPFIDGRADMYGDDFTFLHSRLMNADMAEFRAAAKRWGLSWTLLRPDAPLALKLDHEPGWKRVYRDRWAVIHLRDDSSARVAEVDELVGGGEELAVGAP